MEELGLLLKSRYPLVVVESQEEDRLITLLATLCRELKLAFFTWSVTDGLTRFGQPQCVYQTQEPLLALQHIDSARLPAAYLLRDFHPYLTDPKLVRRLREIAQENAPLGVTLVFSSPTLQLPTELRPLAAHYTLRLPDEAELRQVMIDTFRDLNQNQNFAFRLKEAEQAQLLRNLKGLTLDQARRAISRAVLDDGVLDAHDIAAAMRVKKERIEESGVLEYFEIEKDHPELGGLESLKQWLRRFQAGFSAQARELGLRPPRGILLVGVQGCGKSLAAKTIAREWNLPLLRLDPGRLLDKYMGESEKNLRRAFETAEAVAPIVMWIDEIEKAFASTSSSEADAGLGRRLFGSFLTWLQEKKETVFVAATANDLSSTPPELLRKGRFDEIFFVDLPDAGERRQIFLIHLQLRRQEAKNFNLDALVEASEGFSGAEIEQAVIAALYGLLAEQAPRLTTERIHGELRRTIPLSQSRREYVEELRRFAHDRFVPAR